MCWVRPGCLRLRFRSSSRSQAQPKTTMNSAQGGRLGMWHDRRGSRGRRGSSWGDSCAFFLQVLQPGRSPISRPKTSLAHDDRRSISRLQMVHHAGALAHPGSRRLPTHELRGREAEMLELLYRLSQGSIPLDGNSGTQTICWVPRETAIATA
jgi:hypothetical protein